jgi:hypothetical protein
VHTYGQEAKEAELYKKYIGKVRKEQLILVEGISSGIALVMASIFLFYGYAVGLGAYCRNAELEVRPGEPYTGGKLITVMFCVITASFTIGFASNNVKEVREAQIAGRMCYEVIDNKPSVDVRKKGKEVTKDTL